MSNNEVIGNPSSSGEGKETGVVRSPDHKSDEAAKEWSASEMEEAEPYPMPVVPEHESSEEVEKDPSQ
jgi:hypothetical protein